MVYTTGIVWRFSTQDILIPHPRLLNLGTCSSQDIFKSGQ